MRHILSIDDIHDEEVDAIFKAARLAAEGQTPQQSEGTVIATVFLSPSLRTRVGFQVAAKRLGWTTVDVTELRDANSMTHSESLADTLRTLAGMVDLLVCRASDGQSLTHTDAASLLCPLVNGGDSIEHPTQALIDFEAMEHLVGPIGTLTVALQGDLTMRSVTSLLNLFARRPPARLLLYSPPSRRPVSLPPALESITSWSTDPSLADVDVLYLPGLPQHKGQVSLSDCERERFRFGAMASRELKDAAVVLSPLPVVDEVTPEARRDPRVRMFEQSDRAIFVRMALLAWVLGRD